MQAHFVTPIECKLVLGQGTTLLTGLIRLARWRLTMRTVIHVMRTANIVLGVLLLTAQNAQKIQTSIYEGIHDEHQEEIFVLVKLAGTTQTTITLILKQNAPSA